MIVPLEVVPLFDLARWAKQAVGGSMLLAIPVAALAGLVSFFSPCVLPLLPGYLSYATGLTASAVLEGRGSRHRMLLGTCLFVLGFTLVFLATGVAAGGLGALLVAHSRLINVIIGVITIALGLMFTGWLPMGRRSWRLTTLPRAGIAAAPLLGLVFGLGWTPCIGPALSVVLTLSMNQASALRGGILATVYALGLGIPFILAGVAMQRLAGTIGWVKRHQRGVQLTGGVMMMMVGLALVSGLWDAAMAQARQWISGFGTPI